MTAVALPAAYRDARAADLGLALGLPAQDALLLRTVRSGLLIVELRVLGASHQVLLSRSPDQPLCSETVACTVPAAGLPSAREWEADGLRYAFHARTTQPAAFADEVGRLLDDLAADDRAVCATFPGHPLAATGLRVRFPEGGGAAWQTWHAYPQTGEIVATSTTAEPIP